MPSNTPPEKPDNRPTRIVGRIVRIANWIHFLRRQWEHAFGPIHLADLLELARSFWPSG